jgi:hypothetical protein
MIVLTSLNVNVILLEEISKDTPHLVKQILVVNHNVTVGRAVLMIHVGMEKFVMRSVLKPVEQHSVAFISVWGPTAVKQRIPYNQLM